MLCRLDSRRKHLNWRFVFSFSKFEALGWSSPQINFIFCLCDPKSTSMRVPNRVAWTIRLQNWPMLFGLWHNKCKKNTGKKTQKAASLPYWRDDTPKTILLRWCSIWNLWDNTLEMIILRFVLSWDVISCQTRLPSVKGILPMQHCRGFYFVA